MRINVSRRGTITLPTALRKAAGLDRPEGKVEVRLREDGVIELIPAVTIPADSVGLYPDMLPLPKGWGDKTFGGKPMPNVVAWVRQSREGH